MNKQELEDLINQRLTIKQIATKFSCSETTIRRSLSKYGLKTPIRHRHTDTEIIEASKNATSVSAVMISLGLKPYGYAHARFTKRLANLGIKFDPQKAIRSALEKGRKPRKTTNQYLTNGGPIITSAKLRSKLIEEGYKENKCEECGLGPEWNGKPLSMQLDHIDGNHTNNELENLRILCPNCHTQTPTHSIIKTAHQKIIKNNNIESDRTEFPHLFNRSINEYTITEEKFSKEHKSFIEKYEYLGNHGNTPKWTYTARIDNILSCVVLLNTPIAKQNLLSIDIKYAIIQRGASATFAHEHISSKLIRHACQDVATKYAIKCFIAYVDPKANEIGTIYQACGFDFLGFEFGSHKTYQHDNINNGKPYSRQSLSRTSTFKKWLKENNISDDKSWYKPNGFKNIKCIPTSIWNAFKNWRLATIHASDSIKSPKKGKYVLVLGQSRKETKQLRKHILYKIVKYPKREINICPVCGNQTTNDKYCSYACHKKSCERINWPDNLTDLVKNNSISAIARDLGVSDKAVAKRIKNHFGSDPAG